MTNVTALKSKGGDADELKRMIRAWTQAVHARDADAAVADYADDVRNFDLAPPLQHGGRKTIRDNLQGWFATFSGPVGSELRDLKIETGGDVAFAHGFNRIHGKRTDGSETSVWIPPDARLSQDRRRLEGHARAHLGAVHHGRLAQGGGRPDALIWRLDRPPPAHTRKRSTKKPSANKRTANRISANKIPPNTTSATTCRA
jgi:ketosteroid isomerase-like protein